MVAASGAAQRAADRPVAAVDNGCRGSGRPLLALLLGCLALWCSWCPVDALVSYCREPTPHYMSHAQAEAVCEAEGQYNYPNQRSLLDDLGGENARRRYTAVTLDEKIVAKYANTSEFILHVKVLSTSRTSTPSHCCQICTNDCEPLRYVCPRRFVDPDDNCSAAAHEFQTCRFTEELVDVVVRLVCAVKVSKSRDVPASWYTSGFTIRTSPRNCPYRKLENGSYYLLLATQATPSYGRDDTLTGADLVVAVPKKYQKNFPLPYLRGFNLKLDGYYFLTNATVLNGSCPSEKTIKAQNLRSAAAARRSPAAATGASFAVWLIVSTALRTGALIRRNASRFAVSGVTIGRASPISGGGSAPREETTER